MVIAPGHLTSRPGPGGWLIVTPLTGRVGLRLVGEVDLLNADVLARAIAALPPGAAEIHLQLAGLEFIDVPGTRELVNLAAPPDARRLILHYPPAALLKIIRLAWPEARGQFVTAAERPPGIRGPAAPDLAVPVFQLSSGQRGPAVNDVLPQPGPSC